MLADVLRGYATATLESAAADGHAEALHGDLEGFGSALVRHAELRRVLTDPMISPVSRRAVVADLLEGRATPEGRALISFAVRVSPSAEVPLVLAELRELSESPESADVSVGSAEQRLRGYAERVLEELASPSQIDQVEDDLFRFARTVEHADALRKVLTDQNAQLEGRLAIVHDLLAGRAAPASERLVAYVLRIGRVRNLVGTLESLVELCAEERGRRVAEVRSAVDLDDAERSRLAAALRRLTGREVEVRVLNDPDVVGGVLVTVGDLIIDGTVRLRLERLRDVLVESA